MLTPESACTYICIDSFKRLANPPPPKQNKQQNLSLIPKPVRGKMNQIQYKTSKKTDTQINADLKYNFHQVIHQSTKEN